MFIFGPASSGLSNWDGQVTSCCCSGDRVKLSVIALSAVLGTILATAAMNTPLAVALSLKLHHRHEFEQLANPGSN